MKKVLLIGDSIRMGYDDYVKESLKDIADVYYPQQNCQSSHVVLRNLHYWTDSLELYDATELLGKQVANTLCKALGEDPRRLSYPDPQRYHRPKAYPMDIDAYEKKGHIYVEKRS